MYKTIKMFKTFEQFFEALYFEYIPKFDSDLPFCMNQFILMKAKVTSGSYSIDGHAVLCGKCNN